MKPDRCKSGIFSDRGANTTLEELVEEAAEAAGEAHQHAA
jgi:hypothetical protein